MGLQHGKQLHQFKDYKMTTLIPKFQQTGTGAANRAINLKLAESVSVKEVELIETKKEEPEDEWGF